MARRRAVELVWVVAAAVVAMVVAENGRMCLALGMEDAKDIVSNSSPEAKEASHLWTDQNSWKWIDKGEIKEGALNMMSKAKVTASDSFEKPDAVSDSTSSAKDIGKELYNEANRKVEEAYDMVLNNGFSEEAKAKYEAAKEKASDAAGEVGAKTRN